MHYCIYFPNCHSTFPKNIFIFRSNFRYNRLINLFIIIYLILICNDKWLVKIIVYLIVQRCMHVCTKLERSEKNIFITYNLSIKFSKKLILCYKNTTSLISRYRMNLKKKKKKGVVIPLQTRRFIVILIRTKNESWNYVINISWMRNSITMIYQRKGIRIIGRSGVINQIRSYYRCAIKRS